MGHATYSVDNRQLRATALKYESKPVQEIFTQAASRTVHSDMSPRDVIVRECRNSVAHPATVPIQLYLDVTGSMGSIPLEMIRNGLPKLMGNLIERGCTDASLMFGAIGDHECDRYPLQIGQFESGDAELDMWLTRTYLEGNGGGNGGESYLLAWYFAANHVSMDAAKGFVFTVGDEPCLPVLPKSALSSIMGSSAMAEGTLTAAQLLEAARQKNHVFHIHVDHTNRAHPSDLREMLGSNFLVIKRADELSDIIIRTVLANMTTEQPSVASPAVSEPPIENML